MKGGLGTAEREPSTLCLQASWRVGCEAGGSAGRDTAVYERGIRCLMASKTRELCITSPGLVMTQAVTRELLTNMSS